jgi:hypothetical protein
VAAGGGDGERRLWAEWKTIPHFVAALLFRLVKRELASESEGMKSLCPKWVGSNAQRLPLEWAIVFLFVRNVVTYNPPGNLGEYRKLLKR